MNKFFEFLSKKSQNFDKPRSQRKLSAYSASDLPPKEELVNPLQKNFLGKTNFLKKIKLPAKKNLAGKSSNKEKIVSRAPFFARLSLQDQIIFAKRLAILIHAGIPILRGLRMLEEQAGSRHGARIMKDLRQQIEKGKSLAVAMRGYAKIFGEFAINIVRVGEMSGTLVQNLNHLADELKKKQELRRNIISALIYPAFIVVATIAIVIMLTVFLFPKILPVFASFNTQLPWSTRALIAISDAAQAWWLYFVFGLVLFAVIFGLLMRVKKVRHFWDRWLLRWPVLGGLFRSYFLANSCRTLSLLLKSEVGILEALRVVGETSGSEAYRQSFGKIAAGVARGETVSEVMKKDKLLFPVLVFQMVQVGEATGSLNSSLMYVSEMFEDEMAVSTKNLTTSIEPILMVLMGLLVGFVALSIITPIYGITQSLQP